MHALACAGGHNRDRDQNVDVHEGVGTQTGASTGGQSTGRDKRSQVAKGWVAEKAKGTTNSL